MSGVVPSTAKQVKAATEDSYVCPFCCFTAGVRLPSTDSGPPNDGPSYGSAVTWVVRCVSCGRTSPFTIQS